MTVVDAIAESLIAYEARMQELSDALKAEDIAAAQHDAAKAALALLEANMIVTGLPGKNEAERRAHLDTDDDMMDARRRVVETQQAVRAAQTAAEIARERVRFARTRCALLNRVEED